MRFFTLWAAMLFSVSLTPAPAAPPSVVVILTDDQGYAEMGAYGAKDLLTPNMDRVVAEGMRLNDFRANSCVCSPTRASILTGRYPERAGVPGVIRENAANSWGYLSPGVRLLPERLRAVGYRTAAIGKWHLGLTGMQTPRARGFDYFQGFLGDMMDDYETHLRQGKNYMRRDDAPIEPQGHATDLFTAWACDYIREQAGSGQPFFLYLAYNAPHDPIQPPAVWLDRVRRREPNLSEARAKRVALIEHLDDGIGRVLRTLDETGVAGETLVILTSDNGGPLAFAADNAPWRDGKGSMYEGGLRVPFAVRWPGRIAPGSSRAVAGLSMDIFPTVLAAAGAEPEPGIDGRDLGPVFAGAAAVGPERDLFFIRREGPPFGGKEIEAVIRGPWKLLQNTPWSPRELYRIEDDPQEKNDRAGAEPAIVKTLSDALSRHRQAGGAVPWQPPGPDKP